MTTKREDYLSPEIAEIKDAVEAELDRDELELLLAAGENPDLPPDTLKSSTQRQKSAQGVFFDGGQMGANVLGPEWKKNSSGNWEYKGVGATQQPLRKPCIHGPTFVIEEGGFKGYFGKKYDCEDELQEFDVVLNMTGYSAKRKHSIPIESLKKWAEYSKALEIVLDWPDHGVVWFPLEFWEDLVAAVKEHGGRLLTFCIGGHGRTGTAMACLLITVLGYTADEAMKWIWKNYCDQAIESKEQEKYIRWIGKQYAKKYGKEAK